MSKVSSTPLINDLFNGKDIITSGEVLVWGSQNEEDCPREYGYGYYTTVSQSYARIASYLNKGRYCTKIAILDDLKVYKFKSYLEWVLYLAVTMGYSAFPKLKYLATYYNLMDVLIGYPVTDGIAYLVSGFLNNQITDRVLVSVISQLNIPVSYVFKTQKAVGSLSSKLDYKVPYKYHKYLHTLRCDTINSTVGLVQGFSRIQDEKNKGYYFKDILEGFINE